MEQRGPRLESESGSLELFPGADPPGRFVSAGGSVLAGQDSEIYSWQDAPVHCSAPGSTSPTKSTQRQVDISRQLSSHHRLQAANYKDRSTRLYRPVVVASPAGRTGLREARAAPDRAPAVLLSSLRASDCASFIV